jgi:hypothetical protein
LSGALWLTFHHFYRIPGEFGERAHPLELWWLRLHGLMAFAVLAALGALLPIHARRAWMLGKNRVTGLTMEGVFCWLAITGYALYYFASDANEAWLPLLHWIVGLPLPLMLVVHIRHGRHRARGLPTPAQPEVTGSSASPFATTFRAEKTMG